MPLSGPSYSYWAFLSYCRHDRAIARWLQRALETYVVPRNLVGGITQVGVAPRRFQPIFQDRTELPADADLRSRIEIALASSVYLIVLCSPEAAKSHWVDDEVRSFRAQHGLTRIFTVLVGGPAAGDINECFPPSLRSDSEPIAADLRPGADGRRLTRLKLVAGMLGVGLDELVQRDRQRHYRRLIAVAVASFAGMAAMAALAASAFIDRNDAQLQRTHAEGLIEFMLTDLRSKLEPSGRLDAMDGVGREALKYYSSQSPKNLNDEALGRQARALRLMGEIRVQRGDLGEALASFEQAEDATREILARSPDDGQKIFNHAQNVFWVGEIARQRSDRVGAETSFRLYRRFAQQLTTMDPNNDSWGAEVAYADSALGTLFTMDGRTAEAIKAFERALAVDAALAERHPSDLNAQINRAQGDAWLADALMMRGDLVSARTHRENELAIYRAVLSVDPTIRQAKYSTIIALQMLGELLTLKSDETDALEKFMEAASRAEVLLSTERDNMDLTAVAANGQVELGETLLALKQVTIAREAQKRAETLLSAALAHDETVKLWRDYRHRATQLDAAITRRTNQPDRALQLDESVLRSLGSTDAIPINTDSFWLWQRSRLQLGDDLAALGRADEAREHWTAIVGDLARTQDSIEPKLLVILSMADVRLGRAAEASAITQRLLRLSVSTPDLAHRLPTF